MHTLTLHTKCTYRACLVMLSCQAEKEWEQEERRLQLLWLRLFVAKTASPLPASSGHIHFHQIQSGRNNRYVKKICDRHSDLFRIENEFTHHDI
jgi:hypothetical protein